ncbi:hypothetical protein [Microvirga sp. VF16]|uniref:hypothetical protein n=1 Tax=Microvirga sp. VF16 TaxID=2807101 RepID=UPI00193E3E2B|nr:hypothetical protein [Microvirga sp. VF16]QRM32758.1 hypothetical protein JO965_25595 [Microvirga sp. VF16]
MDFSPAERAYLDDMRMLSTDSEGREVFIGLTAEESAEFYAFTRPENLESKSSEERDRYLELHEKHEKARLQIVVAEIEARHDSIRN